MIYSDHIIEEIRENNDIVELISTYINLKHMGKSYKGLCPFHNENTPSFNVNPIQQYYYCFGCGAGGNAFSFIMAIEGYDFPNAIEHLANRINYTLPQKGETKLFSNKEILYEINLLAARFFYENFNKSNNAIDYIKKRGLSKKFSKKFGIGYSPNDWDKLLNHLTNKGFSSTQIEQSGLIISGKNGRYYDRFRGRLMFPIFDTKGKVIAFGGRSLGDEMPKYINSPETAIYSKSENLYAINFVKKSPHKDLILVEGYMDAIALYQAGFYGIVASLGTAFTQSHGKLISRMAKGVILIFDSDSPGNAAAERAINELKTSGLSIKILSLKNAKDPDEYIKKFSKEDFLQELNKSKNYIDFQIDNLLQKHNIENIQDKIEFTKQAAITVSHIKDPITLDAYILQISKLSGISQDSIKAQLNTSTLVQPVKKPTKQKLNERALNEAKANIINSISNSYVAFIAVSPHLSPHEMEDEIFIKALQYLYSFYNESSAISPARLLNYFHNPSDQNKIAQIIAIEPNMDKKYLSKSLNDQVKLIKKTYINNKLKTTENLENAQKLINSRNYVENLNISLPDG